MSDENGAPDTGEAAPADQTALPGQGAAPGQGAVPGGPRPEPLRLFGTTWVNRDPGYQGYTARRIAASVGSLAAVTVSCLVLRFAYQGLAIADIGSFVTVLVVAMFAICSALAFRHTWDAFAKRPDPDRQASLRGLLAIGFVGSLVAYFFRSLTEAPGEKLHREEYDTARQAYERRTSRRTGNPSKKRRRG
ncbi:EamA/RhaT family transporter [Streptomyces sp. NBC_01275]|uniref:EamA/RhaT family transporter n=1 Tax=Streptomyces sp. NBC_01275 TaxID=2903807 RepID=UPI0022559BBF|nr:EamA/RhaT family transporter [Streptomyces sp. NBC_01275]MCX4764070.1 EamA/RhaT family transporter [Streptomyces sp. NBC_01275]